MCGRYYIDEETSKELKRIVAEIDQKLKREKSANSRDIYPFNYAPVLTARKDRIEPELQKWGYPGFKGSNIIFNARSESVCEKPIFRKSLADKRCIVPASGFYEWTRGNDKKKYYFTNQNSGILYMAGIYNKYEEERFVILTTNANDSMKEVHNRMPLILSRDQGQEWLYNENAVKDILKVIPPLLRKEEQGKKEKTGYEQLMLDL